MASSIPEPKALIIDIAALFGWTASPSYYCSFGRAISWLIQQNSLATVSEPTDIEPRFAFEWVDDQILIEVDDGNYPQPAEATLRHAILAVLGPRSINESTLTAWSWILGSFK